MTLEEIREENAKKTSDEYDFYDPKVTLPRMIRKVKIVGDIECSELRFRVSLPTYTAPVLTPEQIKQKEEYDAKVKERLRQSSEDEMNRYLSCEMTAAKLIEALKKYPDDTLVYVSSSQIYASVYIDETSEIEEKYGKKYLCIGGD